MTQHTAAQGPQTDYTTRALILLGVAVVLYSAIPVAIDLSGSSGSPMAVGAGILIGYTVMTHTGRHSHRGFRPVSYRQVVRRCFDDHVFLPSVCLYLGLTMLGALGYVFFAWSTSYVDTAVASSLFELWPITWMLAFRFIDRTSRSASENRAIPLPTIVFMILGGCSVALVVYSTANTEGAAGHVSLPVFGIILALLAPVLTAMTAFSFSFADRLLFGKSRDPMDNWHILASLGADRRTVEESIVHAGITLSRVSVVPVVLALAVADVGLQPAIFSRPFVGGLSVGLLLNGPASYIVRKAHVISSRRQIISIQYLSPVVALLWLWTWTDIQVGRMDLLVFGTVIVVVLNVLINAGPSLKRRGPPAPVAAASRSVTRRAWRPKS